ncbi:TolC family protein, partial [Salmonella enterica]|nr:TolC family protein [Salmonella enterica]
MKTNFIIMGCLFFSPLALAGQDTLHYADFINEMYKESDMIKA